MKLVHAILCAISSVFRTMAVIKVVHILCAINSVLFRSTHLRGDYIPHTRLWTFPLRSFFSHRRVDNDAQTCQLINRAATHTRRVRARLQPCNRAGCCGSALLRPQLRSVGSDRIGSVRGPRQQQAQPR